MKEKLKASKKYLVVPVAIGLVAIVALSSAHSVRAAQRYGQNGNGLPSAIADHFGLNESEVEGVFQEYHQDRFTERHETMEDRLAERLADAVADGTITQAQMNAYLEKHDELYEQMIELHEQDVSPEDFREMRADLHEELHQWAEENGIDMFQLMRYERHMMGDGMHRGMM